jgi:hypothetical protein
MVLAAATAADWLVFFRARALLMARGLMKEREAVGIGSMPSRHVF